MVRLVFISDVHGNLEALEAVLGVNSTTEVYSLGDLVDYGAEPNEVIKVFQKKGIKSILGNHDQAAIDGDTSQFNARAAMGSVWTRGRLTPESRDYLKSLPLEMRLRVEGVEVYLTHGSPDDKLWEYVDPRTHSDLFAHYLAKTKAEVIGLGHTHIPFVWRERGRFVFNPGSVGQPRDGDRRASYAVLTVVDGEPSVEVKRVEYDYESAASKIRAAGLPESFAQRLSAGS